MILIQEVFDVITNVNAHYKRNELESECIRKTEFLLTLFQMRLRYTNITPNTQNAAWLVLEMLFNHQID